MTIDLSQEDCDRIILALGCWLGTALQDIGDPKQRELIIEHHLSTAEKFGVRYNEPTSASPK